MNTSWGDVFLAAFVIMSLLGGIAGTIVEWAR